MLFLRGGALVPAPSVGNRLTVPSEELGQSNSFGCESTQLYGSTGNKWVPSKKVRKKYFKQIYGKLSKKRMSEMTWGQEHGQWHISFDRKAGKAHLTVEPAWAGKDSTKFLHSINFNWDDDIPNLLNRFDKARKEKTRPKGKSIPIPPRSPRKSRGVSPKKPMLEEGNEYNKLAIFEQGVSQLNNSERKQKDKENKKKQEFVNYLKTIQPRSRPAPKGRASRKVDRKKKKVANSMKEWQQGIQPRSRSAPKGRASRKADRKELQRRMNVAARRVSRVSMKVGKMSQAKRASQLSALNRLNKSRERKNKEAREMGSSSQNRNYVSRISATLQNTEKNKIYKRAREFRKSGQERMTSRNIQTLNTRLSAKPNGSWANWSNGIPPLVGGSVYNPLPLLPRKSRSGSKTSPRTQKVIKSRNK